MDKHQPSANLRSRSRLRNRLLLGVAPALLLVALAAPSLASGATVPFLAGRPIMGSYVPNHSCQGLAYGRVNGDFVLFTAWHCREGLADGAAIIFQDGRTVGWWMRDALGAQHDLASIKLAAAFIPTSGRNRIYDGRSEGVDNYWQVTRMPTIGCAALQSNAYWNHTTYENYHANMSDTRLSSVGKVTGFNGPVNGNRCQVFTTNPWHGLQSRDSGGSFIISDQLNSVFGIATSQFNNKLIATPLKDGLDDINWFYTHNGFTKGAWLCQTSGC